MDRRRINTDERTYHHARVDAKPAKSERRFSVPLGTRYSGNLAGNRIDGHGLRQQAALGRRWRIARCPMRDRNGHGPTPGGHEHQCGQSLP
jgi:hypothetical protein